MSRRSSRLVSKGTSSLPDDDAASTSSTETTGQMSYKESPVRIFKKRAGRKSTGSASRNSSRASSVNHTVAGQLGELTATENENGVTYTAQGFSSGYSSAEDHYDKHINPSTGSAQSVAEPAFDVWDLFSSPAQALVMFYWWLGSAWYSLTSRVSLINVFLLSRCTTDMRKAVLLFLLLICFIFGIWYLFPSAASHPHEVASRTPPVKHTDAPLRAAVNDHFQHASLSTLQDEIVNLHEREANLMRDIELLKMESARQKVKSEMLQTDMKFMTNRMKNVESEHGQQISDMKSGLSKLQSASDHLKERVDALDTLNTNLKAELSEWLIRHMKDTSSLESTIVARPELQRALEDLEKQILDKLGQEKEQARDVWQTVGETLQQEGAGDITVQDVKEIVNRAISLYRADGIGMADYALESSGASVINTRCSETYNTRSACLSLFGIPLWYQSESPRTVIQPELYPGKCWAFRGSQGFLVISLSYPIKINYVSLEHLPRVLSPTGHIDSAPKDFAVYGMSNENEDGKLLGTYTYDQDGEPIQTFKLLETSNIYSMVELRILSNWGHLEYTCVYRFRVHGEPSLA
ncbi:SUN domain-containing protein 2-like [Myxocyprinus asiaticus]|uniref:SUN domain-containing protein 2-like n=1 Tax=Myxocyprinus asiaticus TaxID=70543 RepID=UPI00222255D0|nr:SUN domain-containing protein 2-like [Myxocyprinus asiaticus]XP_051567507.1 SUN domain-containing protein 2-like [Myxocyprinus asiaticus]XP_051567508.1 SUN domain-containing protein 2-like [Myxocyprinus asiaticus]XP_051567509.1 SUN domain-containing protein 2-like [Myxocyprinus asiaticus]